MPRPSRCPICGKPSDARNRPFCSDRCRMVDLNRWFREGYAIPGAAAPEPQADGGNGEENA
ncbi:MAG: DNA gyrase inhibitor YacG [Alphaproteobacteria bacterium]|nr:DNA gyrase inhibitor YacG [Alphaproteobacteria bacterium]